MSKKKELLDVESKKEFEYMESFTNAIQNKPTCTLVKVIKRKAVEMWLIQQELYNRET